MVQLTPTKLGRAAELREQGLSYNQNGAELKGSGEAVRLCYDPVITN
jgi:hypothetical protein